MWRVHVQLMPAAVAKALGGNAQVKNAGALLRYALPIDNKNIRQIQVTFDSQHELPQPFVLCVGTAAISLGCPKHYISYCLIHSGNGMHAVPPS